jgi:NAD(P)-dependent dehydrogenase (short-subunit alcohol dehydrogenase family)
VELAGKTALVTGAAAGIGLATAQRLGREGSTVVVVDVDAEAGRAAADQIEGASFVHADVTSEADVALGVQHAVLETGGLDILVNNAGGFSEPLFPDAPIEHWTRNIDLNLRSVMLGIHFALRPMRERGGGAIVNVASTAGLGFESHPGPEYATAKAGVMKLTACLAPLAKEFIRVNCVCPYTVATEAVLKDIAELKADGLELPAALRAELLSLDEVVDAIVDLVQDESAAGRIVKLVGGQAPEVL